VFAEVAAAMALEVEQAVLEVRPMVPKVARLKSLRSEMVVGEAWLLIRVAVALLDQLMESAM
jgi:hypothetical protein